MAKIQLANGQTVKAICVWDGVKWTDRIGRVYTDKWLDFISYYEKYVYIGMGWYNAYSLKLRQFDYKGTEKNIYDFDIIRVCKTLETDPNGNVYYGHNKGFFIFDKNFTIIRSVRLYALDTAVTKNGDYVVVSEYGVDGEALFFMSKNGETKKIVSITRGSAHDTKKGMCADKEGNIYTHVIPGELTKFDSDGNKLLSFKVPGVNPDNSYGSIDIDHDGNIYRLINKTLGKYDKSGNLIKSVEVSDKPVAWGTLYVDRDFVFVAIGDYNPNPQDGTLEDSLIKLTKNLEVISKVNGDRVIQRGSNPSYGDSVYCDREDGVYTVGRSCFRKNSKNDLSLIYEKRIEDGSLMEGKCACTPGRYGAFGEV
ncbi:hypothetical protein SMD22_06655 [Brevibacillus halotolerans]|nr:hypothetical protein SMD22_06655 [Brevibacillus halotolerans]